MLLRHQRRYKKLKNYRLEFKIMSLFALIQIKKINQENEKN